MIEGRPADVQHKLQMIRILTEIADNGILAGSLLFKGGTCAQMLGFLDRFSVDLDFDIKPSAPAGAVRRELKEVIKKLGLEIVNENIKTVEFSLKYPSKPGMRNTLKFSVFPEWVKANKYKAQYLPEISRTLVCQTVETMFANKLVALTERFSRHRSIAGRDIYDIHYFYSNGYKYDAAVIKERTGLSVKQYLWKVVEFIEKRVTEKIITEDLNTLLPFEKYTIIRKSLKQEVLMLLKNDLDGQRN